MFVKVMVRCVSVVIGREEEDVGDRFIYLPGLGSSHRIIAPGTLLQPQVKADWFSTVCLEAMQPINIQSPPFAWLNQCSAARYGEAL